MVDALVDWVGWWPLRSNYSVDDCKCWYLHLTVHVDVENDPSSDDCHHCLPMLGRVQMMVRVFGLRGSARVNDESFPAKKCPPAMLTLLS